MSLLLFNEMFFVISAKRICIFCEKQQRNSWSKEKNMRINRIKVDRWSEPDKEHRIEHERMVKLKSR